MISTRDLAFTCAMLYQLSYEATDVGNRSVVGSFVPVKEMSFNDIWNKSYMNCGNDMKMKKWSLQWTQFKQLRKEAWKKVLLSWKPFSSTSLAIALELSSSKKERVVLFMESVQISLCAALFANARKVDVSEFQVKIIRPSTSKSDVLIFLAKNAFGGNILH